jgi:hypothetical protein
MTDLGSVGVRLRFEFSKLHDRVMTVQCTSGSTIQRLEPQQAGFYDLDFRTTLPGRISLMFSGKNNLTDTVLDKDGSMVADLFVRLDAITIDDIPIKIDVAPIMLLTTETGEKHQTNYVGFNGQAVLHLLEHNAFDLIMAWTRHAN